MKEKLLFVNISGTNSKVKLIENLVNKLDAKHQF